MSDHFTDQFEFIDYISDHRPLYWLFYLSLTTLVTSDHYTDYISDVRLLYWSILTLLTTFVTTDYITDHFDFLDYICDYQPLNWLHYWLHLWLPTTLLITIDFNDYICDDRLH